MTSIKNFAALPFALLLSAAALASCSSGGSSQGSTSTTSVTFPNGVSVPTSPPASVVKGWAAKWCQAQPGMSKAALIALMGKPTSDSLADQSSWDGYEWQFNAFYDVNGNVRQLDINDIQLSAAEKASLTCDTTRVAP